jgi:peptide/nickel transport system substrate-binding protein
LAPRRVAPASETQAIETLGSATKTLGLAAALALLSASACTKLGTTSAGSARLHPWTTPDTVRIGLYEEPDTLNPVIGTMAFSSDVFQLLFDGLIRYDDRGRAIPDLARELPTAANGGISADGKTITYHLVPSAAWSDGIPVTSADVAFTWQQLMNASNLVVTRDGYDRIARIDTPDAHTVRIVLRERYPPALYLFRDLVSGAIVPKHLLEGNANINRVPFNARPIGSGPYVLSAWEHGNEMRFDANPHYFRGIPKIPHVVLKFVPDQNTVVSELRTHEIDVYYSVSLSQLARVREIEGLHIATTSSLHWEHLTFNTARPPLDEANVRRALCYAVDENAIFAKVYHGLGRAAPTHFNPDFGWGDPAVRYYPYDPAKSEALLDAAGWKRDADGTRRKAGVPLAFGISTVAGVKQREEIEVLLQNAWHAIGADVTVKNFPAATLFAPAGAGGMLYGGKTDVALYTSEFVTPDPDDSAFIGPGQIPPAGGNASFYRNPQIGNLEKAGLATYDVAARRAIYRKIQHVLIDQVPEYILDFLPEITAVNDDLQDVKPEPVGSDLWNIAAWSFSPSRHGATP